METDSTFISEGTTRLTAEEIVTNIYPDAELHSFNDDIVSAFNIEGWLFPQYFVGRVKDGYAYDMLAITPYKETAWIIAQRTIETRMMTVLEK